MSIFFALFKKALDSRRLNRSSIYNFRPQTKKNPNNNNSARFYSDCTDWDWGRHAKLYFTRNRPGPCWDAVYTAADKQQSIYSDEFCDTHKHRTICFNANKAEAGALVRRDDLNGSDVLTWVLGAFACVMALMFALSVKRNKRYERELAEFKQEAEF